MQCWGFRLSILKSRVNSYRSISFKNKIKINSHLHWRNSCVSTRKWIWRTYPHFQAMFSYIQKQRSVLLNLSTKNSLFSIGRRDNFQLFETNYLFNNVGRALSSIIIEKLQDFTHLNWVDRFFMKIHTNGELSDEANLGYDKNSKL